MAIGTMLAPRYTPHSATSPSMLRDSSRKRNRMLTFESPLGAANGRRTTARGSSIVYSFESTLGHVSMGRFFHRRYDVQINAGLLRAKWTAARRTVSTKAALRAGSGCICGRALEERLRDLRGRVAVAVRRALMHGRDAPGGLNNLFRIAARQHVPTVFERFEPLGLLAQRHARNAHDEGLFLQTARIGEERARPGQQRHHLHVGQRFADDDVVAAS